MTRLTLKLSFVVFFLFLVSSVSWAIHGSAVKQRVIREEKIGDNRSLPVLPYVFSTESMGLTLGAGGVMSGYFQDQLMLAATMFSSSDGATGLYFGAWDYQTFWSERTFLGFQVMSGYYPRQRAYSSPISQAGVGRPGSNESADDAYVEKSGADNWLEFKLEYVMPWGGAKANPIINYNLKGGMVQDSDDVPFWNPLDSGVTTLQLKQYNRFRSFEFDSQEISNTIHPVQLRITYNNTDYPNNPSYGSSQSLAFTQDFGWMDSSHEWSFVEFEANKYFSFGPSEYAKQRTIALNFWTGDSPSWNVNNDVSGLSIITDRPPFYDGARLGGFYRMRAYPIDRFNDRSVIYASAEYRYTLHWNPLKGVEWLDFLESDWWQLVLFWEGGRVAPRYDSVLLEDWKQDVGVDLRGLFAGGVFRIGVAFNDESGSAWVMLGHPF